MEFNQLISKKLHSLFTEHGLIVIEKSKNRVKYESGELILSLVHNSIENSNTLWVEVRWLNDFIEIDNYVMYEFFHSDLKLDNLPQDIFVSNVFLFFLNFGERILRGDKQVIIDIINFDKVRSEEYTSELLEQQYLDAANKAWEKKNYTDVLKNLNQIDENRLSLSLKQKKKMAKKRISGT